MKRTLVPFALVALLALTAFAMPAASSPQVLLVGPGGYESIQSAVDAASPGDTVRILAGTYFEAVFVTTPDLTIQGEGRTLVVLDGGNALDQAFTVVADGVRVESFTVKNYVSNGVVFSDVDGFHMQDIHAIDSGTYGLYAIRSTNGRITQNFAEGFTDSGYYIGETPACNCDVDNNKGWRNMLGYSGTANSHLRIWGNEFWGNRAGILMSVLPQEFGMMEDGTVFGTQVHTKIYGNYIHDNNDHTETTGVFSTIHPPVGEGITIAGGWMNEVYDNVIESNHFCGVCVFWLTTPPRGNWIHDNEISGARYGIWWDEWGEDNCFEDNTFTDVQHVSDPDPLPDCEGLLPVSGCPPMLEDFAACRASDARPPSARKDVDLAMRAYYDLDPHEDGFALP